MLNSMIKHKNGGGCLLRSTGGCFKRSSGGSLTGVSNIMGEPDETLDNIVEIDETYVGGKFANMNRKRRKDWQESGKDNYDVPYL